jgi:hypothetical protein
MFDTKLSLREASRRTKTALALADGSLPGAADALAAGAVSFEHVAALAEAKDDLPSGAAQNLLGQATVMAPDKFARSVKRACTPSADVPAEGRTGTTTKGRRWLNFDVNGADGTIALNALHKVMDELWRADHPDRAPEKLELPPYGQRLAEAFVEMCRRINAGTYVPHDGCTRPTVDLIVVINYSKLFGDADAAGICTTIDGEPLPVEVVRKLLVDAKVYPVVMSGNGEVLDYGRGRRYFTETQRRAIAVRDGGTCQFADCDMPVRYSDAHHVKPWSQGGTTDVGNGAPACSRHHDKLTNGGYRIERRNGVTYTYDPNGQLVHTRTNRWRK